mgnify:CR=1 FL=1
MSTILNNKDELQKIPRLPKARIDKIHKVLVEYQYSSKIVIDLTSMGFSNKNALSIVNKYKNKALDKIKDNIYSLIEDMDFNFLDIDSIALNSLMEENDDRRIRALIIYCINEDTYNTGNTYMTYDEIKRALLKYNSSITDEILEYNIYKLNELRKIKIIKDKYYLKAFYQC